MGVGGGVWCWGWDRDEKCTVGALTIWKELVSNHFFALSTGLFHRSQFFCIHLGLIGLSLLLAETLFFSLHWLRDGKQMHSAFRQGLRPFTLRLRQGWAPFLASFPGPYPNSSSAECKCSCQRVPREQHGHLLGYWAGGESVVLNSPGRDLL